MVLCFKQGKFAKRCGKLWEFRMVLNIVIAISHVILMYYTPEIYTAGCAVHIESVKWFNKIIKT